MGENNNQTEFVFKILNENNNLSKFQKREDKNYILNNSIKIDIGENEHKNYEFDKVYDEGNNTYDMFLTLGQEILEKTK